ncbi:hypothetical protein [Allokutzneria albata]|uniref:hypothetical protein n=1 Tax=Allokutzneria albata TaxID=211114 RepID=UPI0012DE375C|nr:hypothetical protein [Allokutzneria albata]
MEVRSRQLVVLLGHGEPFRGDSVLVPAGLYRHGVAGRYCLAAAFTRSAVLVKASASAQKGAGSAIGYTSVSWTLPQGVVQAASGSNLWITVCAWRWTEV